MIWSPCKTTSLLKRFHQRKKLLIHVKKKKSVHSSGQKEKKRHFFWNSQHYYFSNIVHSYLFRSKDAKTAESASSLSTLSLTSCKNVRLLSLDQNKGCLSTADAVGRNEGSEPIIFSIKFKASWLSFMADKLEKKIV